MIIDAFKIMLIGMGTVFFFLLFLILLIALIAKIVKPYASRLKEDINKKTGDSLRKSGHIQSQNQLLMPVISAAVFTYLKKRGKLAYGKEKS